jgi:hypothetical protein
MSPLKTPDNATMPKPNVSRRRERRRQEASGRPGQAKEPITRRKPRLEPKASEPEKPYEMISPEPDGVERVVACCAQKRGRGRGREPGFRMSQEHRTKIQNSRILRVLIDHVEGREEISQARVTAALGLLKKVLPDLQGVTIAVGLPNRALQLS